METERIREHFDFFLTWSLQIVKNSYRSRRHFYSEVDFDLRAEDFLQSKKRNGKVTRGEPRLNLTQAIDTVALHCIAFLDGISNVICIYGVRANGRAIGGGGGSAGGLNDKKRKLDARITVRDSRVCMPTVL